MRLYIQLTKPYNDLDIFITNWLLPSISKVLKSKIHLHKQMLINYRHLFPEKELYADLLNACNSLVVQHKYNVNDLIITIDPNKTNKENTVKLYDLCALINFGSIECPALPIFSQVFEYFAQNFWMFFNDYKMGILPCP